MTSYALITTAAELELAARRLAAEPILAVDLEADSMHHYREQVCLVQVSTPGETLIIDPLAAGVDLAPLAPILAAPDVVKVFHGADYDVRMLHRCYGMEICNLFDTMIACQFLGEPAVGLAAVLKKRFGVDLDKKYQQADWSKRPLPGAMLDYAAKDTSLLIPLYGQLTDELRSAGRLSLVEEECRLLTGVRMAERADEPFFLRFKGAARLAGEKLALLEELLRFRDEEARRRDLPPFKILGSEPLGLLAERMPTSMADLEGIPGLSPKLVERYGRALLQAVRRVRELSSDEYPVYPRQIRPERSRQQEARLKKLKEWRGEKAKTLGIEPGLLANNALLEGLAERGVSRDGEIPGLKGWQEELFGAELREMLRK